MVDKRKDSVNTEMNNNSTQAEENCQATDNNVAEATPDCQDCSKECAEVRTDEEEDTNTEVDPMQEAQKQIDSLKDQLLRTIAEFDNYKKRTIKEKMELIQNGGAKTVAAILPILDDFERAVSDQSEDPKAIKKGMEMIFQKFVKTLESVGVKPIEIQDQDFDTDFHEAVALVPGMGDDKKGKVIDCMQTGYTMNGRVIRHAKVAVGQ